MVDLTAVPDYTDVPPEKHQAVAYGCRCAECPLRDATGPVWPTRGSNSSFLVIGEYPDKVSAAHLQPFSGPVGKVFRKGLRGGGLNKRQITQGYAAMCAPPQGMSRLLARVRSVNAERRKRNSKTAKRNKQVGPGAREPLLPLVPTPYEACQPGVEALVKLGNPHVLPMGKGAIGTVLGNPDVSVMAVRGGVLDGTIARQESGRLGLFGGELPLPASATPLVPNVKFLPTLDPGHVLREGRWMEAFTIDIGRLVRWSRNQLTWRKPNIYYHPRPADLERFLRGPGPFVFDLETDGIDALACNVRCVGIGNGTGSYVVVGVRSRFTRGGPGTCPKCDGVGYIRPLREGQTMLPCRACGATGKVGREDQVFYTSAEMVQIKRILREFFVDPKRLKLGHNAGYYDRGVIRNWLQVDVDPLMDSVILHRLVNSEHPHSLGYVGSIYTDVHSWKADRAGRKKATQAESDEELHEYCLAEGTPVMLADGTTRAIETIVRRQEPVKVLAWEDGRVVGREVTGWHFNVEDDVQWWQVRFRGDDRRRRGLVCTHDHGVFTADHGLVEASQLRPGMRVLHDEPKLSEDERRALLGTLLGDSVLCVAPSRRRDPRSAATAYLQGGHAEASGFAQRKAAEVACLALGKLRPAQRRVIRKGAAPALSGPFRVLRSRSLHQLADLLPLAYDARGARQLTVEALEALGARGLAWWYMDDGCRQKKQRARQNDGSRGGRLYADETCVLSTQRYPREQVQAARDWFTQRFGATHVGADNVLRLGTVASRNFARHIARYLPPEARYKLPRLRDTSTWPPYEPVRRPVGAVPSSREVVEARPFHFDQTKKNQRYRSRRRYCLSVAGPNNFFTAHGLVHNCGVDCAVSEQPVMPMLRQIEEREQTHLIAIDHEVQKVCLDMHHVGMFVDQEARAQAEEKVLRRAVKLKSELRDICGIPDFNPGSVHQLRRLLFKEWQLSPSLDEKIRFTLSGDPSTSDEVLRSLLFQKMKEQPTRFVKKLRRYRKVMKELGTYIVKLRPKGDTREHVGWDVDEWKLSADVKDDPHLEALVAAEREQRGYVERGVVWADGRMRAGYSAHVTPTGRLSSGRPINAQNFPKGLRKLIVPQPGNVLIGADYDQLELRVAAARWGLTKYLRAFEAGWDPHTSVTAYSVFGEAFVKAAGSPFPWMTGTKFEGDAHGLRQLAKIIQYAFQYWAREEMGTRIIRATEMRDGSLPYAHLSVKDVRQMRNDWLAGVPELERGWQSELEHFRAYGWVAEPVHGRRRYFLDGEDPNQLVNHPIQGGAAGLVNDAMIGLWKDIPLHKWGPGTGLLTQTHDALVVECPRSEAGWVIEVMNHHLNKTHPSLPGVMFTAEAEMGMTWKEVG